MERSRYNVSTLKLDKVDEGYIESGATHYIFHGRLILRQNESTNPEKANIAHGLSMVVGKLTVLVKVSVSHGWYMIVGKGAELVPIGNGITVEAYNSPEFSANITASHFQSESFKILETADDVWKLCELLKKRSTN